MDSPHSDFNQLMAWLDYPLFIVTVADGPQRAGCLVGFASQVSIHPPRFMACMSVKNLTFRVASKAEILVVHVVPEEAKELAVLFGGETGDDRDKFAGCEWKAGPGAAPVLSALENWFAGRILDRVDLGDHCGFVLEPIEASAQRAVSSLSFRQARGIEPGHQP